MSVKTWVPMTPQEYEYQDRVPIICTTTWVSLMISPDRSWVSPLMVLLWKGYDGKRVYMTYIMKESCEKQKKTYHTQTYDRQGIAKHIIVKTMCHQCVMSSVPREDGLVRSDCLALETWTSSAEWELAWSCKDGIDISGTALTVDMYIYICIYVCIYIYIYMCVYMYIHIYMCVYVYTYIYMYTYIDKYIYTQMHKCM